MNEKQRDDWTTGPNHGVSIHSRVVCTFIDELVGIEGIPDFRMDNLVCLWNEYPADPVYLMWNSLPVIYYNGNMVIEMMEMILPYARSGVWCDETRQLPRYNFWDMDNL